MKLKKITLAACAGLLLAAPLPSSFAQNGAVGQQPATAVPQGQQAQSGQQRQNPSGGRQRGAGRTGGRGNRTRTPPTPTSEFVPGGVISSAPVLGANGTLYFCAWNNKLYALDGKTGKQLWSFTAAKLLNASPAIGPDGTVYFGAYDHKVYAIDGTTGTKKWEFLTGDVINSSPSVNSGTVYIGSKDDTLYALNGTDGTVKWKVKMGAEVTNTVSSPEGIVYASADGIYALDGVTGSIKWVASDGFDPDDPFTLGSDGTLYVGGHGGTLAALNPATGSVRWTVNLPASTAYPPAVADGRVYVGADRLYALRTDNGRLLWQYGESQALWSTPVVSGNGDVYAADIDGDVYNIHGATGILNWAYQTDDPLLTFPTIGTGGMIFVPSEAQGKLYAMQSRTGDIVWQFTLDPLPPPVQTTPTTGGGGGGRRNRGG